MEAIFRVDGSTAVTSPHAAGPWDPNMQHGGAPAALVVWAAERIPTPAPMQIARATIDLMRPVPVAPLTIETEVLREGRAFGIYPEGTRSRDGRIYRGRTGVAWLALTAGVPVVPVGLVGTDKVQPVGAKLPSLAKVRVAFGTPISPQRYAAMPAGRARRELTDEIMLAIATLSGQERVDAYNELPPGSDPAIGV